MAGNSQIRLTKNDRKEFARLVSNTKAKIRRTAKNYGIDISGDIKLPNNIEEFKTREDFNRFKNDVKRFTNRSNQNYQFVKNEYGVVISKKELNKIKADTKKAQRLADKLIKEANKKPFVSGGKQQGTVGQRMMQMGKPDTAGITRPPDFDFNKMRSKTQLDKKKENMQERAEKEFFNKRMEKMQNNFMDMLEKSFNSDAHELLEKLKEMPPDDFYEIYLMFDEFDFDFFYVNDLEGESHEGHIKQMESYIDRYNQGKINMDLKGF